MSKLFDDASLAMIPSAYKDGKLYSIRPIPEYGSEEVTNGDFATDTAWTKEAGWTISGGKASYNGSATTNALFQNISATSGTTYRVSFSVVNYVSGSFKAHLSNGSATGASPLITANGDYVFDITATGGLLLFRNVTSFNGSIDNVSVQEIVSSGDFTFSRGSNLAATRVNADGLIEKGRENFLTYSNDFEGTDWTIQNITTTSGQVGYDGSNNAWKFIPNTSNTYHRVIQAITIGTNLVVTLSVYAKADGYNFIRISENASTGHYATFNLSTGVVENKTSLDAKIESVGNGWYRCSSTIIPSTTRRFDIYVMESANVQQPWAGDGTSGVLIQDGQFEQGLVATDYIETGASTAQAGILEDMPRLDYSGGASCPSLLLEPQRTNVVVNSEYFDSWTNVRTTDTSNADISPEGLQNATSVKPDSTPSTSHEFFGYTGGSYTTWSGFFKADGYSWIYMFLSGQPIVWFDLENGVVGQELGGATGQIEDYGNGWYRCTYTAPSAIFVIGFGIVDGDGTTIISSPDTSKGVLFYGAQQESGSYPTSYIPTYGTSQTRSLDSCLATSVSDLIGQTQGTMFVDVTINNISGQTNDPIPISLKGSGSTNSYIALYDDGRVQAVHYGFGSIQANINLGFYGLTNGRHKFAFVYSDNDFKLYIDGALAGVDTTGLVDAQSDVYLGYYNTSFNGAIKNHQSLIFPTALTDSECIALTTI